MEKAPPLVLLGGADAHDLVLVEMLIDDYPNIIFVVLTSLNPIIPLRPSNDNPNYIIQVGNVFGFIISIENVLQKTKGRNLGVCR